MDWPKSGRTFGRLFSLCSPRAAWPWPDSAARSTELASRFGPAVSAFGERGVAKPGRNPQIPARPSVGCRVSCCGFETARTKRRRHFRRVGVRALEMSGLSLILQTVLAFVLVALAILSAQLGTLALVRYFVGARRVRVPLLPDEALPRVLVQRFV